MQDNLLPYLHKHNTNSGVQSVVVNEIIAMMPLKDFIDPSVSFQSQLFEQTLYDTCRQVGFIDKIPRGIYLFMGWMTIFFIALLIMYLLRAKGKIKIVDDEPKSSEEQHNDKVE